MKRHCSAFPYPHFNQRDSGFPFVAKRQEKAHRRSGALWILRLLGGSLLCLDSGIEAVAALLAAKGLQTHQGRHGVTPLAALAGLHPAEMASGTENFAGKFANGRLVFAHWKWCVNSDFDTDRRPTIALQGKCEGRTSPILSLYEYNAVMKY